MKRIYIPAIAALMLGATSCNDILDVQPSSQYAEEAMWNNQNTADYYIMASYNMFDDYSQFQDLTYRFYDGYSDLFKSTIWEAGNQLYNKMFILGDRLMKNSASSFDCWSTGYGRIKRANKLLNSLAEYGPKIADEEWMTTREAEIRFCRAMNYFCMARVYGGLVKRTESSGVNGGTDDGAYEEDCNRARMSEAETWQYIIDEMTWAAEHLPDSWTGDTKDGRATRGMVYGFISRMAVFAQQWDVAVDAANKCKEYGNYELVKDYAQLFDYKKTAENRKEVIYAMYYKEELKTHQVDAALRSPGDAEKYGRSKGTQLVPTAELADLYEFKDGTAFNWDNWKKVKIDGKTVSDPFTEREPRFQATILYDGAEWEGRTIDTYIGQKASDPEGVDHWVEYQNSKWTEGYTPTGYYMRKFLMEGYTEFYTKASTNYEIIMRYAEVLLNKAEALGQLGDYEGGLAAINEVRARVGLPAKTGINNLEQFMELLRKERACELAGEGFRYWDLIRWRLAQDVIDGQGWHGVKIIRRGSTGTKTYTTVDADGGRTRMFPERYYRLSLPAAELTNNKLAEDNPGW